MRAALQLLVISKQKIPSTILPELLKILSVYIRNPNKIDFIVTRHFA